MQPPDELVSLSRDIAQRHNLDGALVCAVVEQESSWNPRAIRYEPAFRERYVKPLGLAPTEEIARSISWGLMQVMGQVARERGFDRESLADLCEPAIGLEIGCEVLSAKISAANGDVSRGLESWNGGGNLSYAKAVLNKLACYQGGRAMI